MWYNSFCFTNTEDSATLRSDMSAVLGLQKAAYQNGRCLFAAFWKPMR